MIWIGNIDAPLHTPLGHRQTLYKLTALVRDSSSLRCSLFYLLRDGDFFPVNPDTVGTAQADGVFQGAGFREIPKAAFKEFVFVPVDMSFKRYSCSCYETRNASWTIRLRS